MIQDRILFIKATTSPVGGVGTWLDRAVPALTERGFDPVVCLTKGVANHNPSAYLENRTNFDCCVVDGRGLNREGRIRACQRVIRCVQPTIVLPLGVLDATDAAFRCREGGKCLHVVGRAQGNLPPILADLQSRQAGFDHVVCDGRLTHAFLRRFAGFGDSRTSYIPNGANERTHERIERPDNAPLRLGYVGRLTQEDKRAEDIPTLCQVLDNMGIDYRLTIVGAGPSEARIKAKLDPFGQHIHFTGPQPNEHVFSNVLPNLDVLLLFSSSESFGIVLLEAMMNGVVPVTSRYLGFHSERLVVEEQHGLAFDVADIQSAAVAIQRLDHDRSLLSRLSASAFEHATTNYSWKRCFDQWAELLSRVANSPPISACPQSSSAVAVTNNKLDRLNVPPAASDLVRRLRRMLVGVPNTAGGEEWPLFSREHSQDSLDRIDQQCAQLETNAQSGLD